MKSRTLTRITAMTLLVALAISVPLAAQEQGYGTVTTSSTNPIPLINQPLVPDTAKPGGVGFVLTVNGTGFVVGSVVNWNGSARATTFVSRSQLKASILSADIAKRGTAWVNVVNPVPGGSTSNVALFEITTPTSAVPLSITSKLALGSGPLAVATGGFNGDGKADLALADTTVSVLLGKGDGTFQPAVEYDAGTTPYFVAVGDFNSDGKLDLVVANYGDGKLDLAVGNVNNGDVSILLGNGNGSFQSAENWSTGSNPWFMAAGDFNRDGRLDLAMPEPASSTVSVLLQEPDTGAVVELNPPNLSFGSVTVGHSKSLSTTLTNVGNGERLKRMGFVHENQMKLYEKAFELVIPSG